MRGSCKFKSGDIQGAIKDFSSEIELMPTHLMGYVNRAIAFGELKNYQAAINDLSVAIQIDPLWSQSFLYRGVFYHKVNRRDSGCGDFRMAVNLKNPQADAYSKEYCK
jgi:Tfp pilus assembly protein PilF